MKEWSTRCERGGGISAHEFIKKMINAIMYFHVLSITNVFLHRSNKVRKREKKHAHRRNDVWNTSKMLSILGGCPSLNPSPASIFGLFTTRHKRKFKGKETRRKKTLYFVIRGITET